MILRYCGGRIPQSSVGLEEELDHELMRAIDSAIDLAKQHFETFQVTLALQDIWELIRRLNKYIVEREPWTLAKDPGKRATLDVTLYSAADALRVIAALVDPVMPDTSERIRRMLGIKAESWTTLTANTLQPGTELGTVEPLFPRIEKSIEELRAMTTTNEQPPAEAAAAPAAPSAPALTPPAPVSPPADDARISIDDFMKVELRVVKVLEAEAVPKSKKLVKLKVNAGSEERTIVAGIAESYQPEQLVGRTIVIVANLKPAKLMGIESNGMVLAASADGAGPMLVGFDQEIPPGTRVR
jgi:methionyl-tRNA synthetase